MSTSLKDINRLFIQKTVLAKEEPNVLWENELKTIPYELKEYLCCEKGFITLNACDYNILDENDTNQAPIIMYQKKVNFGMLILFRKTDKQFFKQFCESFADEFSLFAKDLEFLTLFYKKINRIQSQNILDYRQHRDVLSFATSLPRKEN